MRLLEVTKDGGPTSPVDGYVLIETKSLFTISLLKFNKGQREGMHSHAFNAVSWFLSGETIEYSDTTPKRRKGLCLPHYTPRNKKHKYVCTQTGWCLTFRGPWSNWWVDGKQYLTWGRKIIAEVF